MSRRLVAALALALALALAIVPVSAQEPSAVERAVASTEHYELSTSGAQDEADEWVRMLEAAWPQYAEFFGVEAQLGRDERLRVALYEDEAGSRERFGRCAVALSAARVDGGTTVTVGSATFGPYEVRAGSMGFAFENCRATFTDVEIDPSR